MKIREQVSNILRVSQKARDNDKELLIIYMQKFGMNLSEQQIETFRRMPSVETIRRTRQQIQQEGLYPASEKVDKKRFELFKQVRQNIRYENAERILEPVTNEILL